MAQVGLYKRLATYTDKDGKEKTATNFYLQCGSGKMIPIDLTYFKGRDGEPDKGYSGRKAVLSAFADDLPDNPTQRQTSKASGKVMRGSTPVVSDDNLPF